MANISKPPTRYIETTIVVHPSGIPIPIKYLTVKNNIYSNDKKEIIKPAQAENLNGLFDCEVMQSNAKIVFFQKL